MAQLPVMTPEQRAANLAKAAQARAARTALKARLKSGEVTLPEALNEEVAAKMKVSELITALPGIGKTGTRQLMELIGIGEGRRVRGLGSNQRAELEKKFAPAPAA